MAGAPGVAHVLRELLHRELPRHLWEQLLEVQRDQMGRQPRVRALVSLVEDEIDQVEAAEQSRRQVDVLDDLSCLALFQDFQNKKMQNLPLISVIFAQKKSPETMLK